MQRVLSLVEALFSSTARPMLAALRGLGDRLLERRYGVHTIGEIGLERLGVNAPRRYDYKPAPWTTLARVLPRKEVRPHDVFLDLGAGKGRIVLLAARYPFKRVLGVEISPELAAIARLNIERNRARLRCRDIKIITSDALEYEIPDDVTILFLNNPFGGEVFATVIQRLLASVERRPRRVRIIYRNPTEREYLATTGRVRLVRRTRGLRPSPEWSLTQSSWMYEVVPPQAQPAASIQT